MSRGVQSSIEVRKLFSLLWSNDNPTAFLKEVTLLWGAQNVWIAENTCDDKNNPSSKIQYLNSAPYNTVNDGIEGFIPSMYSLFPSAIEKLSIGEYLHGKRLSGDSYRYFLALPLIVSAELYGHIGVEAEWDLSVSPESVESWQSAAVVISLYIERNSLNAKLQAQERALALANRNTKLISTLLVHFASSKRLEEILHKVLLTCRDYLSVDAIELYHTDSAGIAPSSIQNTNKNNTHILKSISVAPWSTCPEIIETLFAGYSFSASRSEDFPVTAKELLLNQNIHALYILPLYIGKHTLGWMSLSYYVEHSWYPEETNTFVSVATLIAYALDSNIKLTELLEAERKQHASVRMIEQASRLASIGTLTSGIAHEINRPLSSLKVIADGMIYWKENGFSLPESKIFENIQLISEQAEKINNIVVHMRAMLQEEKTGNPAPVSINDIVLRVLTFVREQVSVHGIDINVELADGLPSFLGFQTHFEQILSNLVVNAVQALSGSTQSNKAITIITRNLQNNLILIVRDTGPGIPPSMLTHMFNSFVTTKSESGGMGLGLFITKNIVSSLNGTISVGNSLQGGAIFTVSIPYPLTER